MLIWNFSNAFAANRESIPFSQFLKLVDDDQVASVVMIGHDITGTLKTSTAGNGSDKFRTYADYQGRKPAAHKGIGSGQA